MTPERAGKTALILALATATAAAWTAVAIVHFMETASSLDSKHRERGSLTRGAAFFCCRRFDFIMAADSYEPILKPSNVC